jgi:hypothetical protein
MAQRQAAKVHAAATAQQAIEAEHYRRWDEHQALQAEYDRYWQALSAGDPSATMGALIYAFEDNEAAAAPINIERGEATLVVVAPPSSELPERFPTYTELGNLTLKKLPKAEKAGFYRALVGGHLVATLRETFAVAPALNAARVVVLCASDRDAYGNVRPEVLMAGRWERPSFDGVRWAEVDAYRVAHDTASELTANLKGTAQELAPIDLAAEPELAELVAQVDLAGLTG